MARKKGNVNASRVALTSYTLVISPRLSFGARLTNEGSELIFKSRRGEMQFLIPARFSCRVRKNIITLAAPDTHLQAELQTLIGGLYRTMLGVTKGYREKLKTVGVGYKGKLEPNRLVRLVLGYSHPIYYFLRPTAGMKFSRKNNRFNIKGPNSVLIHQTAADMYSFKQPDVYKGKGIRYRGYKLLKKEGKKKT